MLSGRGKWRWKRVWEWEVFVFDLLIFCFGIVLVWGLIVGYEVLLIFRREGRVMINDFVVTWLYLVF